MEVEKHEFIHARMHIMEAGRLLTLIEAAVECKDLNQKVKAELLEHHRKIKAAMGK